MAKKVVKETIHAKGFDISIYTMDFESQSPHPFLLNGWGLQRR